VKKSDDCRFILNNDLYKLVRDVKKKNNEGMEDKVGIFVIGLE